MFIPSELMHQRILLYNKLVIAQLVVAQAITNLLYLAIINLL